MEDESDHLRRLEEVVARDDPYPAERFEGRGIVICGGGEKYLTCAYVCIRMLRHVGCRLPIQFWHLGRCEVPREWGIVLDDLGVERVDARLMAETVPCRILNGWEIKCYSLVNSRFRELIFLDADNVPVVDPTFLFEIPHYRETGALFWPDRGRLPNDHPIWKVCGVEFRSEPEFESGQMVLDKARCWKPLQVAMHLNEWSDFYYRIIHGDKDTFHMAWRKIGQQYAMAPPHVDKSWQAMYQHDWSGRKIFQHRSGPKWSLDGENAPIPGFDFHAECVGFIDELRDKLLRVNFDRFTEDEKKLYHAALRQRTFLYARAGHNSCRLEFLPNLQLRGGGTLERKWTVEYLDQPTIVIEGDEGVTCRLRKTDEGVFTGRWLLREKMPVTLVAQGG